jgi:predicted RNase H-like HicB family nuclease
VTWSENDKAYVGLCTEFPSLSWLAKGPEIALKGIRDLVADVIKDKKKSGEKAPRPLAEKNFSGKFMVRVPPEIHRDLAIQAAESGVSLNRLASAKLSRCPLSSQPESVIRIPGSQYSGPWGTSSHSFSRQPLLGYPFFGPGT